MTHRSRLSLLATGAVLLALPLVAACSEGDGDDRTASDATPRRTETSERTATIESTATVERTVTRTNTATAVPDDSVAIDIWTEGLCISVTSWLEDVEELSGFDIPTGSTPEQIKEIMVRFLTDVDVRTKEFQDDIDALGDPETDDGPEIQAAFSSAAEEVVTIFGDALETAKALQTSDRARLADELIALGDAITEAGDEVGETFSQIDWDFDTTAISRAGRDITECGTIFDP